MELKLKDYITLPVVNKAVVDKEMSEEEAVIYVTEVAAAEYFIGKYDDSSDDSSEEPEPPVPPTPKYRMYYTTNDDQPIDTDFTRTATNVWDPESESYVLEWDEPLTVIPQEAFQYCDTLTSITIPSGVVSIGFDAFYVCSSLANINIPDSVVSIGRGAFYGCSSLPVIDNIRYADTYLVEVVDKTLSSYSIKEGTKWIGGEAFQYCDTLTSITIPSGVVSIGTSAFNSCESMNSITVPESVTSVGDYSLELHGSESGEAEPYNVIFESPVPKISLVYGPESEDLINPFYAEGACGQMFATIIVPKGSKNAYATHDSGWEVFEPYMVEAE